MLTPEQMADMKRQYAQAQVDAVDPLLEALGTDAFKDVAAKVTAAAAAIDGDFAPDLKAHVSNLALQIANGASFAKAARDRLYAIANPPPAPPSLPLAGA